MVEVVVDDGGVGGNQFFTVAQRFENAQGEAVVFGVEKIDENAGFACGQQVVAVGQRVGGREIAYAGQSQFLFGLLGVFRYDAKVGRQAD